jgi:hypothetical protein
MLGHADNRRIGGGAQKKAPDDLSGAYRCKLCG